MASNLRRPHQHVGGSFIPRCNIAAFCESEAAYKTLSNVFENPIMSRASTELKRGSLDTVMNAYEIGQTPDLIILEFSGFADDLDALAEICSENTFVIIIGNDNDVIHYRRLVAKGVEDYLFHPLTEDIVISSLMRTFAGQRPFNSAKLFTAVGAGGGVGSSTVAQSIAVLLAQDSQTKVLLLDLDLYFGTSTLNFGFTPVKGLRDLLRFSGTLAVNDVELLMSEQRSGLFVLASEPDLTPPETFDIDGLMKILDLASLTVDYVVCDLPSGWGDLQSAVVSRSDKISIVAEPTLLGFRNAVALKAHLDLNPEPGQNLQLVLNRYISSDKLKLDVKSFQKSYPSDNITVIGDHSDLMMRANEESKLPIELSGNKQFKETFTALVKRLSKKAEDVSIKPDKPTFLEKVFKRS
jgi:pilus assembly protein CpaE